MVLLNLTELCGGSNLDHIGTRFFFRLVGEKPPGEKKKFQTEVDGIAARGTLVPKGLKPILSRKILQRMEKTITSTKKIPQLLTPQPS